MFVGVDVVAATVGTDVEVEAYVEANAFVASDANRVIFIVVSVVHVFAVIACWM